jgi:hypothetical protein
VRVVALFEKRRKRPGRPDDLASWLKLSGRRRTAGEELLGVSGISRRLGRHRLLFLRASAQAQHAGRNGHDHNQFDKFHYKLASFLSRLLPTV